MYLCLNIRILVCFVFCNSQQIENRVFVFSYHEEVKKLNIKVIIKVANLIRDMHEENLILNILPNFYAYT